MPNDHYVPQMYLRNFSPDDQDGGCIRLVNLVGQRYVSIASIKGQCKRAGFHDYNSELERALGILEGAAATVIKDIIRKDRPPTMLGEGHQTLTVFIAIQRSRTVAAANKTEKMMDAMFKLASEDNAKEKGLNIRDYTLRSAYPVALPLSTGAGLCSYAVGLGVHLFVNMTPEEFITSDNPVVVHNKFCENVTHVGVLGWNCGGILVLFPISPRHVVLLYDTGVYAVGTKSERVSKICDLGEVRNINAFQIVNALENIYFRDTAMAGRLICQIEQLAPKRKIKRIITVQTEQIPDGDEETSEIIHQYERLIPLALQLTSLRIKRSMRRMKRSQRATMQRAKALPAAELSGGEASSSVRYPVRRSFST